MSSIRVGGMRGFCCIFFGIDGSGKISARELKNIFQALNVKVNGNQLDKLIREMDEDGSGE